MNSLEVVLVSGVGEKGTSRMALPGKKCLGPDGAQLLANVLQMTPANMLKVLDLRQTSPLLFSPHKLLAVCPVFALE